jgi:hypothetical protein
VSVGTLRFTVGRLLCGPVRDYLKSQEFIDPEVKFLESSGWIERQFTVRGPLTRLTKIRDAINLWSAELDAEDKAQS